MTKQRIISTNHLSETLSELLREIEHLFYTLK